MDELMQLAMQHIPERPAFPKRIWQVEHFATTATGKIQKPELRRMAAERVVSEALAMIASDAARLEVRGIAGDNATRLHVEVAGLSVEKLATLRNTLASFRLAYDLVTS